MDADEHRSGHGIGTAGLLATHPRYSLLWLRLRQLELGSITHLSLRSSRLLRKYSPSLAKLFLPRSDQPHVRQEMPGAHNTQTIQKGYSHG